MNKKEYDHLQQTLSKKMEENLYIKYGFSGNRSEGFKQGILVAKSIIHNMYESQHRKENTNE